MKFIYILFGIGVCGLCGCGNNPSDDPRAHGEKITCLKNMKQIGLSFRMWANDNREKFPFNVSTNEGGTLELCAVAKDGFDDNSVWHFQVMSNELNSPKILVCPGHPPHVPATDWQSLQASNVTYRVHSGPNVDYTNPTNVLAVCPFDGNTVYCDGKVVEGKSK
jgi:hypothetical protein